MGKFGTIKGKLTGVLLLLVSVALIILVTGIVVNTNAKMVEEEKTTLNVTADMYGEQFNTFFEEKISFIEGVASSTITYGEYEDRDTIRKVVRA